MHNMATTIRCRRRQDVNGNTGDKATKIGKILGMGFRVSKVVRVSTYNLVPRTLFSFTANQFRLAKVLMILYGCYSTCSLDTKNRRTKFHTV